MAEFVEVMRQFKRMCGAQKGNCTTCGFYGKSMRRLCVEYMVQHPKDAEEIVFEWAEEHPERPMLTRMLDAFPRADVREIISMCPGVFVPGWPSAPHDCVNFEGAENPCADCWNRPAPEE